MAVVETPSRDAPPVLPQPSRRNAVLSLVPAGGVVATWAVVMPAAGGFAPADHLPAGLGLLGLLVAAMIGARRVSPPDRTARIALAAFGGFVAWNFASLLWSDAPAGGWDAANLLLVTLLGAWILALAPWWPGTALWLMVAFGVAAAVVCAVTLLSALGADDLTSRFTAFRYNQPLDYPNTSAAFTVIALVPLLVAGARRETPAWASGLLQGLATVLFGTGLLAQSRGALVGALAAFAAMLLLAPHRWRLASRMVVLLATFPVLDGPARDIYNAALDSGRASAPLRDAATTIGLLAIVATLAVAVLAVLERRLGDGPVAQRRGRVAGLAAGALAVVVVAGLGVAHAGSISDTVSDQWRSLRHPGVDYAQGHNSSSSVNRLYDTDPRERYDYWRVSVDGFLDAPVGGMGAGGFQHRYERDRRYAPLAKYPHNLTMSALGDTGLVGVLLLASVVGALGFGLLRRRAGAGTAERATIAAAGGVAVAFAVHGQFDWLEAYPVLTGPALAFPLVALGVRRAPVAATASGGGRRNRLLAAACAVAGVVAAISLVVPWVADRYASRARGEIAASPAAGYSDLKRAADVNPLDPAPLNLLGSAAVSRGDLELARRAYQRALRCEDAYLGHFGLALVAQRTGDHALSVRQARRALALNSVSPQLRGAVKRLERAKSPDVDVAALLRAALTDPVYQDTATVK